jgi:anti-anti-sigma factor
MNTGRHADGQVLLDNAQTLRAASRQIQHRAATARARCDPPTTPRAGDRPRPQTGPSGQGHGYVLVEAVGAIDLATQHELNAALIRAIESGVPDVIVDLNSVTLLSAAALHCLEHAAAALSRRDGRLHLVCPPYSTSARLLRILDPDHHLPRYVDVPTAIAAVTCHA